jgi:L-aspartate oxidase
MNSIITDILVIGGGFAGTIAAINAAENGAKVTIVSEYEIFSGSSFSKHVWGSGIVGPADNGDEENFCEQILKVSQMMAYPEMVNNLVKNILPEVQNLIKTGLNIEQPKNKKEHEYISCFDIKNRSHFIFLKHDVKEILRQKIKELEINSLNRTEVISLLKNEDRVNGAIAIDEKGLLKIVCKCIILASGGICHLFKNQFGNEEPAVLGQYMALKAGAMLTNIEFMQMICGFIEPQPKTFFNERTFKYCTFYDPITKEKMMNDSGMNWSKALEIRSTHGPFSSELYSKYVDIEIYKTQRENKMGVLYRLNEEIKAHPSQFMDNYFKWLKNEKGLTVDDPVIIGSYYHASNGGIKINTKAETGVKGLYACGEVTTGMHGADRIGGMSMANCLVYGSIAGREAARYINTVILNDPDDSFERVIINNARQYISKIHDITFDSMLICRSETSLNFALTALNKIEADIYLNTDKYVDENDIDDLRLSYQLKSILFITKAEAIVMLLRKESRGSHFREDYPEHKKELERKILVKMDENSNEINVVME